MKSNSFVFLLLLFSLIIASCDRNRIPEPQGNELTLNLKASSNTSVEIDADVKFVVEVKGASTQTPVKLSLESETPNLFVVLPSGKNTITTSPCDIDIQFLAKREGDFACKVVAHSGTTKKEVVLKVTVRKKGSHKEDPKYSTKHIPKIVVTSKMVSVAPNDATFPENCWNFELRFATNQNLPIDRMWVDVDNDGVYNEAIDKAIEFDPSKADPNKPTASRSIRNLAVKNGTITIYAPVFYVRFLGSKITDVNLSENELLSTIDLAWNELKFIDLSKNDKLEYVDLFGNELEQIKFSSKAPYELINIDLNKLTPDSFMEIARTLPKRPFREKITEKVAICVYQDGEAEGIDPYNKPYTVREKNRLPKAMFPILIDKNYLVTARFGAKDSDKRESAFDRNGTVLDDKGTPLNIKLY